MKSLQKLFLSLKDWDELEVSTINNTQIEQVGNDYSLDKFITYY